MIPGYLKALLFPPANMFVLVAIGWMLRHRWPRLGRMVMTCALVALFLMSLPVVSGSLMRALESVPPLTSEAFADDAGAIVVLSAGLYRDSPEYGGDTVDHETLERLRYGAWLHRATGGVPLLTTGGSVKPGDTPLGEVMASTLTEEFRVPVRWIEDKSENTFGNAELSAAILRAEGITKVYVVTSASHMPRAMATFEAVGFRVIPAPTGFASPIAPELGDFVPRAGALKDSARVFYEVIGRLWYRLAYF